MGKPLITIKRVCKVRDVSPGELFVFGESLVLCTEYERENDPGNFRKYIVGSGESWGGDDDGWATVIELHLRDDDDYDDD